MARLTNLRRRHRDHDKQDATKITSLGVLLLADAEDLDDELIALSVLALGRDRRRKAGQLRSGRWGPRGPYNEPKVFAFLENILYYTSDRKFRAWMRYVQGNTSSLWAMNSPDDSAWIGRHSGNFTTCSATTMFSFPLEDVHRHHLTSSLQSSSAMLAASLG